MPRESTDIAQSHFSDLATERLSCEVTLDRAGNASVDGAGIDLDELRARLAKFKDLTSNAFWLWINADPECPVKQPVGCYNHRPAIVPLILLW